MTESFLGNLNQYFYRYRSGCASVLVVFALFFSFSAQAKISAELLERNISQRLMNVEEFKFIRETAEKMGIRVWLFGGTAAGYAHYAKQYTLREQGDKRFQSEHFDDDFTNIYRSTQDLDIVADGTPDQIEQLQRTLSRKYRHFLGGKLIWEVRSLRHPRGAPGEPGYKEALLGDFDFLNQNSDSNSTGMVELTQSQEPVVRDLRDWDAKHCQFFKDVLAGRNHFYRSSKHFQTARAKAGNNPEIFAAIRALTKAFQFELDFTPAEMRQIQNIITDFDPLTRLESNTERRLIDMGKKLIKHAVNVEYAWDTIEKLGLRKKLMGFDSLAKEDSLAWWMNKAPLRSFKVGKGTGKTAEELNIDVVAHETNTLLSYESITRAHTGDPNFLESREGYEGEAAILGNGVYTRIGRQGARNTGLTIRLKMDPKAREGTDFIVKSENVLVLNKNAFRVIPEKIEMSLMSFFELLKVPGALPHSERALIEKFKRRWSRSTSVLNSAEIKKIRKMVKEELEANGDEYPVTAEFFSMPFSKNSTDLMEVFFKMSRPVDPMFMAQPHWINHPKWESWMRSIIRDYGLETALDILSQPEAANHPATQRLSEFVFEKVEWWGYLKGHVLDALLAHTPLLTSPRLGKILLNIVKDIQTPSLDAVPLLATPTLINSKEWTELFKKFYFSSQGITGNQIAPRDLKLVEVLFQENVTKTPGWLKLVKSLIDPNGTRDPNYAINLLAYIAKTPTIPHWEELYESIFYQLDSLPVDFFAPLINGSPVFFKHPKWANLLQKSIKDGSYDGSIFNLLLKPDDINHPEFEKWVEHLLLSASRQLGIWYLKDTLPVLETLVKRGDSRWVRYVATIMSQDPVADARRAKLTGVIAWLMNFFSLPEVQSNSILVRASKGGPVTHESILQATKENFDFSPVHSIGPSCRKLFLKKVPGSFW